MANELWKPEPHDAGTHRKRLNQIRQLARGFYPCTVADIGCGTGEIAWRLTRDGANVTAIDCSDSRVMDRVRQLFHKGDAIATDLQKFNLIVCAGLLYHLDLESQLKLVKNIGGKPVILDTHFSRHPDSTIGDFSGQFRQPTWSTKVKQAFVHTIPSLRILFSKHHLIETFERLTPDRQVMLMVPR